MPLVYQSQPAAGWSCRLAPTPARSTFDSTPTSGRWLAGPIPDSISSCGLLIAPPLSTTSRVARTVCSAPAWRKVTPVARLEPASSSTRGRERPGLDGEVGARARRLEVALVDRPAPPLLAGDLVEPGALLLGAVEVVGGLEPGADRAVDERVAQLVGVDAVLDVQRPLLPVQRAAEPGVALGLHEVGQHVVEAPALRRRTGRARSRSRRGCRGCRSSRSSTSSRRAPSSAASRPGGRAAASARWSRSSSPTGS